MMDREIGRYWVLEQTAQGPWGSAFRGMHKSREEMVVIRELAPSSFPDAAARERFVRAATFLRRAAPRRIERIHLCRVEAERVLLVTESLPETLEERLAKDGPLAEAAAVQIALTLLEALQYLQRYQITLGDLSPSTIHVADDGTAKLAFFGPVSSCAETGPVEPPTPSDNVFAVAAALRRMVGLDQPREGSKISPELKEVVAKAMASDPKERYATAGDFAESIRRVAGVGTPDWSGPSLRFPREAAALALLGFTIFFLLLALSHESIRRARQKGVEVAPRPRVGMELPPAASPAPSTPPPPVSVRAAIEGREKATPLQHTPQKTKPHHRPHARMKTKLRHRITETPPAPRPPADFQEVDQETWSIRK